MRQGGVADPRRRLVHARGQGAAHQAPLPRGGRADGDGNGRADGDGNGRADGGGNGRGKREPKRERERDGHDTAQPAQKKVKTSTWDSARYEANQCFTCGKTGHQFRNCPKAAGNGGGGGSNGGNGGGGGGNGGGKGKGAGNGGQVADAAKPSYSKREARVVAAVVGLRNLNAEDALATLKTALTGDKTCKAEQGKPRKVGQLGRGVKEGKADSEPSSDADDGDEGDNN